VKIAKILKPNKKWLVASVLLITACAGAASGEIATQSGDERVEEITPKPTDVQTSTPENTLVPIPTETQTQAGVPMVLPDLLPDEPPPSGAERQFSTDFSKHTVPYVEILSGGPPKDGIPAIEDPKFTSVAEADQFLEDQLLTNNLQIACDERGIELELHMCPGYDHSYYFISTFIQDHINHLIGI